jgi:hypothetical protein
MSPPPIVPAIFPHFFASLSLAFENTPSFFAKTFVVQHSACKLKRQKNTRAKEEAFEWALQAAAAGTAQRKNRVM